MKTKEFIREIFAFKKNFKGIFVRAHDRYTEIDGLRALSIFFVILFHVFIGYLGVKFDYSSKEFLTYIANIPSIFYLLGHGDKGVDIFFVLSGFLLSVALFRELDKSQKINIKKFYIKRLLRIMPAYLFLLLIAVLANWKAIKTIWIYIILMQNFLPVSKLILHHTWSLCVEMQFYVFLPFILQFIYNTRKKVLSMVSIFLGVCMFRLVIVWANPDFYNLPLFQVLFGIVPGREAMYGALYINTFSRLAPLFLGILVAYLYVKFKDNIQDNLSNWSVNILFFVGIALVWFALHPIFNPFGWYNLKFNTNLNFIYVVFNRNIFSVGISIIMLLSLFSVGIGKWLKRFLSLKFWFPLSQLIFPMYLFHIGFIILSALIVSSIRHGGDFHLLTVIDAYVIGILTVLLTFGFSVIIHLFLERPGMNAAKEIYR